jgi:hypothetical protein
MAALSGKGKGIADIVKKDLHFWVVKVRVLPILEKKTRNQVRKKKLRTEDFKLKEVVL